MTAAPELSPTGPGPTVSVVVPSYRRLDRLPAIVAAYREQGADQVVVVLDGPHPGWRDVLADPVGDDLTVVELPENVGLARARIAGLEAATGQVVLAVDDDVVPSDRLVARHREFHARSGVGDHVLQGYMPMDLPVRRGADESPSFVYARDYELQARAWRAGDSEAILGSLWGGNVSLPRDLYERAERLLPSIRLEYNEDLDLGLRLSRLGARASFDAEARGLHRQHRTLEQYRRECEARGRAIADLERRWGRRPKQLDPIVTIPPSYQRLLAAGQRAIAGADRPEAVERFAVAVYRVAGWVHAWRLQDGVTRFLRRALAMRGYRMHRADHGS